MVVIKQFTTSQFSLEPSLEGRLLFDSTLKSFRYHNSTNYNNIIVNKDNDNNVTNINNFTLSGNLNISNHDSIAGTGLILNGTLVSSTASQLNYTNTTQGIAAASKALILDLNRDISNINILTTNSLVTESLTSDTFNTTGNVGINTSALDFGLEVNSSIGECLKLTYNDNNGNAVNYVNFLVSSSGNLSITPSGNNVDITTHNGSTSGLKLGGTLITATANELNYTDTIAGSVEASKAMIVNSDRNISNLNNLSMTGNLSIDGITNLNDTTDATSSTAGGCLTINGGTSIAKKLYVGTDFDVGNNVNINGTLEVTGGVTLSSDLTTIGNLTVGGPILSIPTGNTATRPATPQVGYVRYNTETSQFEGYGAGNAWGSLGGVSDVNQDTKILAEEYAGANDDNLRFFNNGSETMRLTNLGKLGIGTNSPDKQVEINSSTGDCLRLTYNDINGNSTYHCDFTLTPSGSLTISPTGSNPNVSFVSNVSASSFSASKQNVANNTVDFPMSLTILPDTAAANGLGSGIEFNSLNDSYTIFTLGTLEYYSTNVADGNENSNCRFRLANNGEFNIAATLSSNGYFTCLSLVETSDIRVKENIKNIDIYDSVEKINKLESKTYNFINDSEKKTHIGFIAQEVKEIIPEVVNISKSEEYDDFHSINYTGLIPHLVNCIKNLNSEVNELKNIIKNLQNN